MKFTRVTLAAILGSTVLVLISINQDDTAPDKSLDNARISVRSALGNAPSNEPAAREFERAINTRPFNFPADHGPHPSFRHEWWYFTGNLQSPDNDVFGYQLTFFRIGLRPPSDHSGSPWRTDAVFMAHLAVSDVARERFIESERFSRAALGMAGAEAEPFGVWLDNWRVGSTSAQPFPLQLSAQTERITLTLNLEAGKPIVLQGDKGLSRKSAEPGNASYYYSLPRMPTSGEISIDATDYPLTGNSWLDREWGTSALAPDQAGWDWFALQLDDDRELMFYQLRHIDGSAGELSAGTLIGKDGTAISLDSTDVLVTVKDRWQSPESNIIYPAAWHLHAPVHNLDLNVIPVMNDQELNLTVRYWEGAVRVEGSMSGVGYVELAGY